jgi:predicted peptidase
VGFWLLVALMAQLNTPVRFTVTPKSLEAPDAGTIRYGLAVPRNYDREHPGPLVLALHPGGGANVPYYGLQFMQQIVIRGFANVDLAPIIIAPDVPARSWSDPVSEKAVMALVKHVLDEYPIDKTRVLVTGFSMGGRGTWFFESRHHDLFTGGIVMAGATGAARWACADSHLHHSRHARCGDAVRACRTDGP